MADDERPAIEGAVKEKLIASKRRWAQEGRLLTGAPGDPGADRLPPGQREVRDWPVLDLGLKPRIDLDSWRLEVDGLVGNSLSWNWEAFLAEPQVTIRSDIHCVTAWSRFDNLWEGVSARHIVEQVAPEPRARFVVFHGYDGYTTNVALERFDDEDVLLAHSWEGKPIPLDHGGPVRIIIPKLYFWKSAKWVKRIEFALRDRPGFWEVRGYHNEGDPWKEERYG